MALRAAKQKISKKQNVKVDSASGFEAALLITDMVNHLEFKGGEALLKHALPVAKRIAKLKQRARQVGMPAIYVNDNFGQWRSDFRQVVDHCLEKDVRGRPLATLLKPGKADYFVLKPKNSAFFAITLNVLLDCLGVKTLILTGIAGDSCVLFTANDAYLRDYRLIIPSDCIASIDSRENSRVLEHFKRVLKADITCSTDLVLENFKEH